QNFGVSRSNSIGVKYWDLDLFRGTSLNADSLRDLHENEAIQKSMTTRLPGGGRVDVEVVANIYQEGERRTIQLNIRDITDRRRAEEGPRRGYAAVPVSPRIEAIGRVAADFTNLLGPLIGHTESLKARVADDDVGRVAQISETLERAGMLARQLTVMSGP